MRSKLSNMTNCPNCNWIRVDSNFKRLHTWPKTQSQSDRATKCSSDDKFDCVSFVKTKNQSYKTAIKFALQYRTSAIDCCMDMSNSVRINLIL